MKKNGSEKRRKRQETEKQVRRKNGKGNKEGRVRKNKDCVLKNSKSPHTIRIGCGRHV